MAFNDPLTVDDSAKASQESFLAVCGYFKLKNGFVSRKPDPDYGVDLDVELLYNDSNPTGWEFPIQIKSQQNLNLIRHGVNSFVSHSILTSRLGYLCRRAPAYGLVVLYDDKSGVCYYDYVEEIVKRLTSQHDNEDWKNQKTININIPIENTLRNESVERIHRYFYQRFLNNQQMLAEHGEKFDIPVLIPSIKQESEDLSSPEKVIAFIEKYGVDLYNKQCFMMTDGLLSKLSFAQILQFPKVLYVASITYESLGKYIEADYFLSKSLQQPDKYTIEEQNLLRIARYKVDFALGKLSIEEYVINLERVLPEVTEPTSQIYIRVRLMYLKMGELKTNKEAFTAKSKEISELIDFINISTLSDQAKHYYKVFLAGAWFLMLTLSLTRAVGLLRIKEKATKKIEVSDRLSLTKFLFPEFTKAHNIYRDAYNFAKDSKDDLLRSYTFSVQAQSFFQFISNSLMTRFLNAPKAINDCMGQFDCTMNAFNYFMKNGLLDYAFQAITTAHEIYMACVLLFKHKLQGVNEVELKAKIDELVKQMGRRPYVSPAENIKEALEVDKKDPRLIIIEMSDAEIEDAADITVEAWGLPVERRVNVLADLKFMKDAYTQLKGMNFDVIQDLTHTKSVETMYKDSLSYALECSKCGFQTIPGVTLSDLLADKKKFHSHVCL